jgi:2-C-methyl-D-erythritol 4-phosphate cytidylyltransferase
MNIAVLLAGGSGSRFGSDKILASMCGKPVFLWSIETCIKHPMIDGVVLVVSETNQEHLEKETKGLPKISAIVRGGESRFESAVMGYEKAKKSGAELVLFHNLANPGVSKREISEVVKAAQKNGAAGVGRRVSSTLRSTSGGTIPRENLYEMETPQAIRSDIFEKGIRHLEDIPTDDLQIAEAAGVTPEIVLAEWKNRKITTPDDLYAIQKILQNRISMRIGIGQDSHRFSEKGKLILGGVEIQDAPKLYGNSDGDAVFHALTNAISSALGGGSLSTFSDEMCQSGITDSSEYLKKILIELQKKKREHPKYFHCNRSRSTKARSTF